MLMLLLGFSFILRPSHSHVRLVCPRPLSPRSDISIHPGEDISLPLKCLSMGGSTDGDIMDIQPGLFTIRFEETQFLTGAPFRILLMKNPSVHSDVSENEAKITRHKRDTSKIQPNENDSNVTDTQTEGGIPESAFNGGNATSSLQKSNSTIPGVDSYLNSSLPNYTFTENGTVVDPKSNNTDASDTSDSVSSSNHTSENNTKADTINSPDDTRTKQNKTDEGGSKIDSSVESCLLLDHIPHNNHAIVHNNCSHNANTFPLGNCKESTYYITVLIPDVNCPECLLVVQKVNTDPDHTVCELNEEGKSSDCITYISCSRVKIRASTEGLDRNLSHCSDYQSNLAGDWPYRAQDVYMTEEKAVLTMDLRHKDLHIEVAEESSIGPVEKVEVWVNSSVVWSSSDVTPHPRLSNAIHAEWKNMPPEYLEPLKANQLILNVVGNKESKASDILYKEKHFKEGHMTSLYDVYSQSGWLIAPKFIGPYVEDSVAATPVGDCAPVAKHYMSFFESVEGGNHGLLGMSILENRAYITSVLHVQLGYVISIRLIGSDLIGAKTVEISAPSGFNGVIQTTIDVTQQIKFIDTVRFFKSVEVKTNRDNAAMVGDLEEGFFSVLRDSDGEIKGMGALQLTQGYWMQVQIFATDKQYLNDVERNMDIIPEQITAELISSHSQLLDLSKEAVYCHKQFCCLEGYVHELSSDLLLHLLNEQATLRVNGDKGSISGQVFGRQGCRHSSGLCQISHSLPHGTDPAKGRRGGIAKAMVIPDRAQVLELSIEVKGVTQELMSKKYSANIQPMKGPSVSIPLIFSKISDKTYIGQGRYPLSKDKKLMTHLSHPQLITHLKVTDGRHTLIDGTLPFYDNMMCISGKIHVVGKGKSYWSSKSAPFEDIHAVMSDNVKFVFDNNSTSLYQFESLESYENCDFSKAKKLNAVLNAVPGMDIHFVTAEKEGTFYYADSDSCNSSHPAKVILHVIKAGENMVRDGTHGKWCRTSFYAAWREKILDDWEAPSTSGSIALGLGMGLLVGFIFLLWQGVRMKQSPPHGLMGRRASLSHFVRF